MLKSILGYNPKIDYNVSLFIFENLFHCPQDYNQIIDCNAYTSVSILFAHAHGVVAQLSATYITLCDFLGWNPNIM